MSAVGLFYVSIYFNSPCRTFELMDECQQQITFSKLKTHESNVKKSVNAGLPVKETSYLLNIHFRRNT